MTNDKHSMQTLVFSATLTFTHIQPQQTVPNIGALNSSNKLNQKVKKLIEAVRLRPKKHIVIDLTIDTKTPQSLLECRMNCINLAHKVLSHPGIKFKIIYKFRMQIYTT